MKKLNRVRDILAATAVISLWCGRGHGQAINIDVQMWTDSELGGDVPSDLYGAGSGQIGRWTPIDVSHPGPFELYDVRGNLTSATVYHPAWGNGGGWNNSDLSGDFRALMADAEDIGAGLDYRFSGLLSGWYDVWTYCGSASRGFSSETFVKVPGAIGQEEVRVAGTMPANYFVLNRSHSVHRVQVIDGSLRILARENWPDYRGYITGFQLVPVPEPLTIITISVGIAALIRSRRRSV